MPTKAKTKTPYTDDEVLALMRRCRRYEDLTIVLKPKRCAQVVEFEYYSRVYFQHHARGRENAPLRYWLNESGRAADRALKSIGLPAQHLPVASEEVLDAYIERVRNGEPDPLPSEPFPWEFDELEDTQSADQSREPSVAAGVVAHHAEEGET